MHSVCRMVLGEELEMLYDSYYKELQHVSDNKPRASSKPPSYSNCQIRHNHKNRQHDHGYEANGAQDDNIGHESDESGILEFGTSLTVKGEAFLIVCSSDESKTNQNCTEGGILTVADDFLKNDGQKFLNLMEQLSSHRRIQSNDDDDDYVSIGPNSENSYFDDAEDEEDYEEDEDVIWKHIRIFFWYCCVILNNVSFVLL